MAKNWAIVIGINQYGDFLQPLNYAKRDAQLVQEFLRSEAGFERIFFFSDDSLAVGGKSTRPYRANLLRILRELFENHFMEAGDNFWFFFSGHGMRYADRDYLMPSDGDPGDIENTAIPINYITERLRRCGADNVVLILDACRSVGTRAGEGIGRKTAEDARQTGVISIFSCSPNEYSYEIDALQQGAFTYALLEGLGIQGQCATVERLNQYLTYRVPELSRQHEKRRQTPYIIAEPVTKSHLILVPRYATLVDIATLKNDAYRAQVKKEFELAKQLWIRVLAAVSGQDMEAIEALQEIAQLRAVRFNTPFLLSSSAAQDSGKRVSVSHTPSFKQTPTGLTRPKFNVQPESPNHNLLLAGGAILLIVLAGFQIYVQISRQTDTVHSRSNVTVSQTKLNPTASPNVTASPTVDYTRLQELLAAGKWKEADQETQAVMLKVSSREKEGWLQPKDIQNFSCPDLSKINQFWVKYSNGRFGFNVQKLIWQEARGKNKYQVFVDKVGRDYVDSSSPAPIGHFPSVWLQKYRNSADRDFRTLNSGDWVMLVGNLAERAETCKL